MCKSVSEKTRVDQLASKGDFDNYLARVTWRRNGLLIENKGVVYKMSPFKLCLLKIVEYIAKKILPDVEVICRTRTLPTRKFVAALLEKGVQNKWITQDNLDRVKNVATNAGLVVISNSESDKITIEDPSCFEGGEEVENPEFIEYQSSHSNLPDLTLQNYQYDDENKVLTLEVNASNGYCVGLYLDPDIKETRIPQRNLYVKSVPTGTIIPSVEFGKVIFKIDFKDNQYRKFLDTIPVGTFVLNVHSGGQSIFPFTIAKP